MADGDLRRRRMSQRLIKLKEARTESDESRMIKLKREWGVLLDRQRARIEADTKVIEAKYKALAEEAKARSAGAPPLLYDPLSAATPPPPCDPFRPLWVAPPPPPPCDPLSAAPPPPLPCDPLSAAPPAPLCDPFRPLWVAPPPPPPCDSSRPLSAPPPPAGHAGKKKKTKKKVVKWKVPQERIDLMILNQRDPFNDYPLERLLKRKRNQKFREKFAELRALAQMEFEYQQAIIKQFREKGYAEDYSEAETEDDDEN